MINISILLIYDKLLFAHLIQMITYCITRTGMVGSVFDFLKGSIFHFPSFQQLSIYHEDSTHAQRRFWNNLVFNRRRRLYIA